MFSSKLEQCWEAIQRMPGSTQPLLLLSPTSDTQDDSSERLHELDDHEAGRSDRSLRHSFREKARWNMAIRMKPHKRQVVIVGLVLCLFAFASFTTMFSTAHAGAQVEIEYEDLVKGVELQTETPTYPPQVLGPPTDSLWDNLRNDTLYITGWYSAGWTNEVFILFNLLYLALLTGRTAILPPFDPSHVSKAAPDIPISDVFDLQRLSQSTGIPLIEWDDLKTSPYASSSTAKTDQIGCWTAWADIWHGTSKNEYRDSWTPVHWRMDVSYSHIPKHAKLQEGNMDDPFVRLSSLAALTFPDGRKAAGLPMEARIPAKESGHKKLPDEHLACFDFLYYAAEVRPFEIERDYSPVWRFIGTHAHWSSRLISLTQTALAATFGLVPLPTTSSPSIQSYSGDLPPFISLHVRHGDFAHGCDPSKSTNTSTDAESKQEEDAYLRCFEPLSAWVTRVEEIKKELKEKKGVEVEKVVMMSDEKSERWWREVGELGWLRLDHDVLGTEARYGEWYPVFIDAVAQSLGTGFVGTEQSTMSLVAARRVTDWNGGVVRYVNRWKSEV